VALLAVGLAACGSSDSGRAGRSWCPQIPELTADRKTDLTGKANTYSRVAAINGRYGSSILRRCRGVVGVGVSTYRVLRQRKRNLGPPARATETDYVLLVNVKAASDLPDGPLFLEGVPLVFRVSGEIHAL
jgi:hypothetical protein